MPNEIDLFGEPVNNGHKSVLARSFDYPPFSVLNARDGWWQERKRQWLSLGIQSELGRGGGMMAFDNQHGLQDWQQQRRGRLATAAPGGNPRPTCGGYRKGGRLA